MHRNCLDWHFGQWAAISRPTTSASLMGANVCAQLHSVQIWVNGQGRIDMLRFQENASLRLAQLFLAQASSAASRLTASMYLPRIAVLNTPVTKTIANAAKCSRGVALLLIM